MRLEALCETWAAGIFGVLPADFAVAFRSERLNVAVRIALTTSLDFKTRRVSGRRAGGRAVRSPGEAAAGFAREARQRLDTRLADLPRRPQPYQAGAETAFREALAGSYAIELGCTPCHGSGRVTCMRCTGSGSVTCSSCGGWGKRNCSVCGGSGSRTQWVHDSSIAGGQRQVYVACGSCNAGTNLCAVCGTSGKISCGCAGGKVSCGPCGGTGAVTDIYSAEVEIHARADIHVVEAPDGFARDAAEAARETVLRNSLLEIPGAAAADACGFDGTCAFEDGEIRIGGGRARLVAFGAHGEGVAATRRLDEACGAYRARIEAVCAEGLPSLLGFADASRLAASQVSALTGRLRAKAVRRGIAQRALAPQQAGEARLTQALLSPEWRDACARRIEETVLGHDAEIAGQERAVRRAALWLYGGAAGAGLLGALIVALAVRTDTPGTGQAALFLCLLWAAVAALGGWWTASHRLKRIARDQDALLRGAAPDRSGDPGLEAFPDRAGAPAEQHR